MDESNSVQVESYTCFVRGVRTKFFLFVSLGRVSHIEGVSGPCLGSCSYPGSTYSPWRGLSFGMEGMAASVSEAVSPFTNPYASEQPHTAVMILRFGA